MPDPTPQVIESANRFRQQLLSRERRAASAMVRYYGDTWRRLQPEIRRLRFDVEAMHREGKDISRASIGRLERLESIQSQAQTELLRFAEYSDGAISGAQREAIAAAERDAPALMRASYPPDATITVAFDRMPRAAVEQLVGTLQDGSPLKDLLVEAVGSAADDFTSTMVAGMSMGWNPRRLARAMRSEFGMGLTQALRISRTEQMRAYNAASLNAYRESDVCKGWEWMATLSPRTCMACLEQDGTQHSLDEDFTDHVQGRCTSVPITKTYAEMGIDAPEPDFTREKGHDWFLRQEEGVQRGILGTGKYDAWKEGKFALTDVPKLVKSTVWGNSWTPKSLKELLAGAEKAMPWAKATMATGDPKWQASNEYNERRKRSYPGLVGEANIAAKQAAMKDIAARLVGDADWERLVSDSSKRVDLQMRGVSNIPEERVVAGLINGWADTSGDSSEIAIALQKAAAREFGAPKWDWPTEIEQEATDWARGHEAALRKFLRAMYDNTQDRLQADGIDSLFLWRGMSLSDVQGGFGKATLDMQPMSSFAADLFQAKSFAHPREGRPWIAFVGTEVPRERIIGSFGTGYGCFYESEYVVLGGDTESWLFTTQDPMERIEMAAPKFEGLIEEWLKGQP